VATVAVAGAGTIGAVAVGVLAQDQSGPSERTLNSASARREFFQTGREIMEPED
jgi:hypothetical protein